MTKVLPSLLGALYVAAVVVLFVRGAGELAAMLTIPAWIVVGTLLQPIATLLQPVASALPDHVLDVVLFSWTANLVIVSVCGVLNAVLVARVLQWLMRRHAKRASGYSEEEG